MKTHRLRQRYSASWKNMVTTLQLPCSPHSQHELSADEYARVNNLSIDSESQFASSRLSIVNPLAPYSDVVPDGSGDDSHLPSLQISSPLLPSTYEHLTDHTELLDQCLDSPGEDIYFDDSIDEMVVSSNIRALPALAQLKIEPPFLRTDHEYDCRELSRSISLKRSSHVDCTNIPSEILDEANDEGLSFPSSASRLATELTRACRDEKFHISQEAASYLTQQLKSEPQESLKYDVGDKHNSSRRMVSKSFGGYLS